jgi:hypothetical protein
MSVTVTTPGVEDEDAVPEPPDFPYRPLPADLTRRVRRRARWSRLRRVCGSLTLTGAALGTLWLVTPGSGNGAGPPRPTPPAPTPNWAVDTHDGSPGPRTGVGLGGSAWIGDAGPDRGSAWCVGSAAEAGYGSTIVATCHFLPTPGRLDAAALDPGRFAPAGQRLVVAILLGQSTPTPAIRAEMIDAAGPQQMRLDRPAGLPGVAYLWAFGPQGPVSITVYDANDDIVTACAACTDAE